ncbi:MAG: cupin [Verrucomicrobiales bacterium]|nr:cupin [Verrucomicrobiales bacterium]|tara:strand:+ start:5318 stop:5809 length:492 start_codon:yes stop_codon:yes gene_type:complete
MYKRTLQAPLALSDLVETAIPDDGRLWVPQSDTVDFRPLLFNTTNGEWINLLRVRGGGQLGRHRHASPVYGYVLKGTWRYLEHDWVAREGMFVYEPPGEIHTLVVEEGAGEMITLFHVLGSVIYYDENDHPISHDDVHVKLEMARAHYDQVGLGADFANQFIR